MPNATFSLTAAALLSFGLSATAVFAEAHDEMALSVKEDFQGATLAFEIEKAPKGLRGVTLTVSGPRNYTATVQSKGEIPKIDLRKFGKLFDGPYQYEITAASGQMIEVNTPIDENGRTREARKQHMVPVMTGGNFAVLDGKIVSVDKDKEEEETK